METPALKEINKFAEIEALDGSKYERGIDQLRPGLLFKLQFFTLESSREDDLQNKAVMDAIIIQKNEPPKDSFEFPTS